MPPAVPVERRLTCGSAAVRLDWRWEIEVPELKSSVFQIPGDTWNKEQDQVCVPNSVARSIIERCRGKHPTVSRNDFRITAPLGLSPCDRASAFWEHAQYEVRTAIRLLTAYSLGRSPS